MRCHHQHWRHPQVSRPPLRLDAVKVAWILAVVSVLLIGMTPAAPVVAQASDGSTLSTSGPIVEGLGKLRLGVYDPHEEFKDVGNVSIEHIYLPWRGVDLDSLDGAALYVEKRNRELFITVEPWSWDEREHIAANVLHKRIVEGDYDDTISKLCGKIGNLSVPIAIRWGHEMDLSHDRYPWAQWQPKEYIAAYRHFVTHCREKAPDVKFIWSPRGEPGLQDYYPGKAYVDLIGLTILGLEAYDKKTFGAGRSLFDQLMPSYELVAFFEKPVIIIEFGCVGGEPYILSCSDFSPATLEAFPRLTAVVFFSEIETGGWANQPIRPDWRVTPDSPQFARAVHASRSSN